jgi:hypothetical protein
VQLRTGEGTWWTLRRITVTLKRKTRNGDTALVILTNLPIAVADAMTIAACYRSRWGIETAFQKLECHLNSEIETLGYPQGALFAFCLAPVAFNLYAVVMAALRATHPTQAIDQTVSEYYLAGEIATTMTGLTIAVPEQEWALLAHASPKQFAAWLLDLASQVDLRKRVRSKLMWSSNLSCCLLEITLPVSRPLPVCPGNTQREHGLGVVGRPPGAGALEALLHDIAVGTFDLAGADGQPLREGALVVETIESVAQIAMTGPYRCVRVGHAGGLQCLAQRGQDRCVIVVFQAFLLKLKPALGIPGSATPGRLGEVVADMEEVHRITALSAEARRDLVGDPHRPVAEGMDLAVSAHAGRDGTGQQLPPGHRDTPAQGGAVDPRGTAVRVRQTQLGFFPQQPLPPPTVRAVGVDLHQRHHAAVDFGDHGRGPRLGRPRRFVLAVHDQRAGVPFGHLADGARRQDDAVMRLEFSRRLCKRQIRPQIRHHPL